MKLSQILEARVDMDILEKIARALDYTTASGSSKHLATLEKYYNHPAVKPFMYEGPMYRIIFDTGERPGQEIDYESDDYEYHELTKDDILLYAKQDERNLWSFSKKLAGAQNWSWFAIDDDQYCYVVTKQTGRGYDVSKIYRYLRQFSDRDIPLDMLKRAGGTEKDYLWTGQWEDWVRDIPKSRTVAEVVAPINNSIEIIDRVCSP